MLWTCATNGRLCPAQAGLTTTRASPRQNPGPEPPGFREGSVHDPGLRPGIYRRVIPRRIARRLEGGRGRAPLADTITDAARHRSELDRLLDQLRPGDVVVVHSPGRGDPARVARQRRAPFHLAPIDAPPGPPRRGKRAARGALQTVRRGRGRKVISGWVATSSPNCRGWRSSNGSPAGSPPAAPARNSLALRSVRTETPAHPFSYGSAVQTCGTYALRQA